MATPSPKDPHMVGMLDALSKAVFGRTRTEAITADLCVQCGQPATRFRSALDKREFSISGLCQGCQDQVFGTGRAS